jgi:hypothetical protein
MSGPLLQAANHARPLLVSSIIAGSLGRFDASSFAPTLDGIASALERFSTTTLSRDRARRSAAFESAAVAVDAAEQTPRV